MVKLLQAIGGASHGGAELFFTRLAIGLEEAGQQQIIVMRKDKERAQLLKHSGIYPLELRFGGRVDFLTQWKIKRAINSYKPDIVLSWMNRATSKIYKGPFVHAARLGGYYNLKYYKNCDHLIGNTPQIVEYLKRSNWPVDKCHYIPNFVDHEKGTPIDRAIFNTPNGVPLIISLGRLHKNKAFDVLIKAMVELKDTFLWLAGDGEELSSLTSLAEEMGVSERVKFLGWQRNTKSLIATCDALICPSRHEPLGNVVLEGWAQSKPVIAAASDGPRYLIEHGKNGLLSPVDDPISLASMIKGLLNDPKNSKALAKSGNSIVISNFTKSIVVSKYQDLFDEISS